MKIGKIYPRDIIAALTLAACFFMLYKGIDTFVTAAATLIIGYYFSKRVYEENQKEK